MHEVFMGLAPCSAIFCSLPQRRWCLTQSLSLSLSRAGQAPAFTQAKSNTESLAIKTRQAAPCHFPLPTHLCLHLTAWSPL